MWWPLPASPSRFSLGILQSCEHQRAGGRAANSQLVFFRAHGQPRRAALDQKRGELFAVDFGEDRVQPRDAAVGDPLLFAVENVVRAIGRKRRAGADVHGVGAGAGLGQSIGADPLAGGELGQVALLLFLGPVPDQRQRGDADVRAKCRGKTGQHRDVVGDQRGAHLVHPHAAVLLGNVDRGESQLGGLAQQRLHRARLFGLDGRRAGQNLFARKLLRSGRDLALLFVQVFGGEDFIRACAIRAENCRPQRRQWGIR